MTLRRRPAARAISLIETVISAAILAGLMAAVLGASSSTAARRTNNSRAQTARQLADELAAEIATLHFDPLANVRSLSNRAAFNDLADADRWTESPPQLADGTTIPGLAGWSRSVSVEWVLPTAPTVVSPTDTGCRRITVKVTRGTANEASAVRLVTRAARAVGGTNL